MYTVSNTFNLICYLLLFCKLEVYIFSFIVKFWCDGKSLRGGLKLAS